MATKKTEEITEMNGEELVPVYLFKDASRYKDDVFVAVNGEGCLIQRGKQVMIKKKFADVLAQSAEQDAATAELIQGLAEDFNGMNL